MDEHEMVSAKVTTESVERVVLVERKVVTLTLPWDVARTLRAVAANTGGDHDTTYRSHTGQIDLALYNAGVDSPRDNRFTGSIYGTKMLPKQEVDRG